MAASDLVLDRDVRDWVLIPVTLSLFLMMLIRQYVTQAFLSGPPDPPKNANLKELREKQVVARAAVLKQNFGYIPEQGLRHRKSFFIGKDHGVFLQTIEQKTAQEQLMANPEMMTDMLKKNMGGIVPQIAMGSFVSYFFSGFIMGRVPFPLSPSFRVMLQRGVDLPSLDVTYFTSLSYYILLLFGLNGLLRMLFRDQTVDESQMYKQQMAGGMANPMGPPDPKKAFEAEKSQLEMLDHKWKLATVEAEAAEELRRGLGITQKVSQPRKKLN